MFPFLRNSHLTQKLRVPVFTSQPVATTESSRVQTKESRGVRTDRLESNEVRARSSGFLVLFEHWASKELYSDGKY